MPKRSGQGYVYQPTYQEKKNGELTGKLKKSARWWIGYSVGGKKHKESSGSIRKADANRLLTQRLTERGRGISGRDLERVTFEQLAALIRADYAKNGRRSGPRLERSLRHLTRTFAGWRAVDIAEDAIDRYAADRLAEGAANATANRELAALRRMFRLAQRARMVLRVPAFALLAENNVRTGFLTDGEFATLRAELPEHLRPLLVAGYVTGWRVGELLSRRWRHVDLAAGWIRLEPGETKNAEGRQFPVIPLLRDALEAQHARKLEAERCTGRIVEALFFYYEGARAGQPVKDFRGAWESACKRAGVPGLLFHDLRRTAARNLIRAMVSEHEAMQLTGHKTRSIFARYAIVDEGMLQDAGDRLAALHGQARPERKVVPLAR